MKLVVFGTLIAVLRASAQVFSAPDPAAVTAPSRTSTSECAVQSIFDNCLEIQNNYIKGCGTEPSCLCRYNKQKESCWDNCPNDSGRQPQIDKSKQACSVPGASVSITPWSNTLTPTSTNSISSSTLTVSVSTATTAPTKVPSGSSAVVIQNACLIVLVASIYMLF
ncbi:hypothetical protein BY458DRAFT_551139 [Sporodiniella umbellata]|nr:hypothetical protein BY458DRAFT_551139 [Sporodiniella umbellata]